MFTLKAAVSHPETERTLYMRDVKKRQGSRTRRIGGKTIVDYLVDNLAAKESDICLWELVAIKAKT